LSIPTVRENIHPDSTAPLQLFAQNTQREKQRHAAGSATLRESDGEQHNAFDSAPTFIERDGKDEKHKSNSAQNNPLDRYTILETICSGAEAQLHLAQRKLEGDKVVLKIYHRGISPDPAVLERLMLCSSGYLVRILDHGLLANREQYFEVSEYYPNGDLSFLRGEKRLPEISCRIVLEQLAAAIAYLHLPDTENRVLVHRDIKPANILLRSAYPLNLLLCDFGISTIIENKASDLLSNRNCTPKYAAPELFSARISALSDYWSLGITMVELLTGSHPLNDVPDAQLAALHLTGWRPDLSQLAPKLQQLVSGLTEIDSQKRWGQPEIETWLTETTVEQPAEPEFDEEIFSQFQDLRSNSAIELAARLALCWQRIAPLLDDSKFRQWLEYETQRLLVGKSIAQLIDAPGPSNDIRLLRLIYRIAPSMHHVWKEWSLRRPVLADYCTNAMNGDVTLLLLVEELNDQGVLKELAALTGDIDVQARADAWQNSVIEYEKIKLLMEQLGAPVEKFPPRNRVLPILYLLECEDGRGLNLFNADVNNQLLFFNLWLEPLVCSGFTPTAAQRLLRSIFLPNCIDRNKQNFKIHHESSTTSVRLEGVPIRSFGWNPPTISLSAEHIDFIMTIGDEKKVVAKGVHLRWEVRNALLVHLTGFGLVRALGERPNERMAQATVHQIIHECPCSDHNSAWFTITQSTVFSIRAINIAGFSSMQLPPIVVPPPVIEMECPLNIQVPDLLPPAELTIPVVPLFEVPGLFSPMTLAIPIAGQKSLPQSAQLEVPKFVKRDIWPESYEKTDALLARLKFRDRRM